MNLEEAIKWAEYLVPKEEERNKCSLVYYVAEWNGGYCVYPNSHIERHPNIKWIYNTKDKKIIWQKIKNLQN